MSQKVIIPIGGQDLIIETGRLRQSKPTVP
jgi:hypothetical protein